MKTILVISFTILVALVFISCNPGKQDQNAQHMSPKTKKLSAKDILGNPNYPAISYGGYRKTSRDSQPSVDDIKEDMKILSAMGIKFIRTYNVHFPHASNVLEAISQLQKKDSNFEMYVMLGAWIDCKDSWTATPDHEEESVKNADEIKKAIELTNKYPEIVKVLAVGNEAMVKWAASYFVQADVILKWVNHLQRLKKEDKLPADLWITSSDNFASWGGGDEEYHTEDLNKLIKAVDYISVHTYPMHDTHYNSDFWGLPLGLADLSKEEKIVATMKEAKIYALTQYESVANYVNSLGIARPIHIGETGWASFSNGHYGDEGSKATDEYKEAVYYQTLRDETNKIGISCFYFEAFDEIWKDSQNPGGSENHFGLFTIDGKAKFALWDLVDQGVFEGLTRNGNPITKTYGGSKEKLLHEVMIPPIAEPQH